MITSTSNAQVKELVKLRKSSKLREKEDVFLAEGSRMVLEAPPERILRLYLSESYEKKRRKEYEKELEGLGVRPEILSDTVFNYISDTKTPQGILAVVRRLQYKLEDLLGNAPHILVLDNLQDPGNLGTMFRTAEAAGVTGILLSGDCVDIYNPKTIRSTMGAVYRMPFLYQEGITEGIRELKKCGIRVFAAHLDGRNSYTEEDFRGGTAFLIGNEGNGLRKEVADCADAWIRIPMAGRSESLNAAIAAAVLMFETSRQRREL